jgi:hypothetical protein
LGPAKKHFSEGRNIMNLRQSFIVALLLGTLLPPACWAQSSAYKDMLRRLPDSTNVVVVVDVASLRTALGGTAKASEEANITSFAATANKLVLGAELDLAQRRLLWSIGIARLGRHISIQNVAQAENEPVEEFAGHSIVPTPRNAYFVDLGNNLLGSYSPASRQMLKAWLGQEKTKQLVTLPPYILSALQPEEPALVVIAIDLSDSMDPTAIHRGLNASEVMSSLKKPDYDKTAKTLEKIKSLTLLIRAGNPLNAELTVSFDAPTKEIRGFAKRLLIEGLQKFGVYVQDFDGWKTRLKENSIGIYGPLSLNAARKYAALIKTPAPNPEAADINAYNSTSPAERMVNSSKRYFKSITKILDDLKIDKAKNVKAMGEWYDRFAEEIDNMAILDVDPDLVKWAAIVASNLRAMGASLKGISIQSSYLQRQKAEGQVYQAPNFGTWSGGYNPYYGAYNTYTGPGLATSAATLASGTAGGVTTVNNFNEIRQQQDQLVTQGTMARNQLWQQIDQETANMRKAMTLKYKSEF